MRFHNLADCRYFKDLGLTYAIHAEVAYGLNYDVLGDARVFYNGKLVYSISHAEGSDEIMIVFLGENIPVIYLPKGAEFMLDLIEVIERHIEEF